MNENIIDAEEEKLLNSYDREEWQPVENVKEAKERYQGYAYATVRKDARVNIRISSKDLQAIQKKAIEEGIPYQTLIGSILHKYAAGRLVERSG